MTKAQKLSLRLSEIRQRLNEIAGFDGDDLTDEIRSESDKLTREFRDSETQYRAAVTAESEDEERAREASGEVLDSETRERLALRGKVRVLDFVQAAMRGRVLAGPAAEYSDAEGAGGEIPLSLFEPDPREQRDREERAVTSAPGTVGVNMAPIQPAVFSSSIAKAMMIDMPQTGSGSYGQATITTSLGAGARVKGADQDVSAAAFTVATATPKSVSARLEMLIEDIASAGHPNFEAALRENLSMALSAELDDQLINGSGQGANIRGLFAALTTPTAADTLVTFPTAVTTAANLVDGLWATELMHIRQIVGVATYRKFAQLLTTVSTGETTLAEYLKRASGGLMTNSRMPAAESTVQAGLACRTGRMGAMRTAVSPHWGTVGITDVYSGSARGQTAVTFHVLVGDVLVIQPDAYSELSYKIA